MIRSSTFPVLVLLILVCFLVSCQQGKEQAQGQKKPNIVLLMADDMGFECLSSNGSLSHNTPELDKLAAGGIKFNFAISQPLCTPSRVKIMTGKYNYRNYKAFTYLDVGEKTFGNYLRDAGYSTCVVGKWQLNGLNKNSEYQSTDKELYERPLHFGFEEYCLWNFIGSSGNRYADPKLIQNGELLMGLKNYYGPDVVSEYAMDFMERNKDNPFFLYYPMILVHSPFVPTPDSKEWQDENQRLKDEDRYFKDMVEYTDKIIHKLTVKIDELGLTENTIFIFTADNGTHYKLTTQTVDGPFRGGKGTMPDAGTHVPMIVYNPSMIPEPFEYNELFEFSDFLPSFLEMAGIPIPDEVDGRSFYPLFSGKEQPQRETVFVHYDPLKAGGPERWYGRFVRNIEYKLYNNGRFYRVSQDPREKNPLSDAFLTSKETELKKAFQEELDSAPEHYFKQRDEYKK